MVRQSAPPGDEGSMDEEMLDGAPEAEIAEETEATEEI